MKKNFCIIGLIFLTQLVSAKNFSLSEENIYPYTFSVQIATKICFKDVCDEHGLYIESFSFNKERLLKLIEAEFKKCYKEIESKPWIFKVIRTSNAKDFYKTSFEIKEKYEKLGIKFKKECKNFIIESY